MILCLEIAPVGNRFGYLGLFYAALSVPPSRRGQVGQRRSTFYKSSEMELLLNLSAALPWTAVITVSIYVFSVCRYAAPHSPVDAYVV